jgi:lysozyme family protein
MVGHIFVVNYKFIIMKDLNSQEYFFADSQEEAKKEKEKRAALHSIFPILMGGKEDKTNYVIRNENKTPLSTESPPIATSTPIATNPMGSNAKKEATSFENPKNDFNFDPWQREKTLDNMRVVKYPKLFGEMGTHVYPRANYHSKEEFDYINRSKFESIIGYNLEHEGGYVNNKNDRGGETKYGITKPFMEEYQYALPGGKAKPIKDLTVEDAKLLYKAMWDRYNLGYIRDKDLAYVVYDYMINSYAGTAAKRIQEILNTKGAGLKVDGHLGEMSLKAIHNSDYKWLIDEILKNRQYYYREQVKDDSTQLEFYAGWMNRLNKIAESVGSDLYFSTHF